MVQLCAAVAGHGIPGHAHQAVFRLPFLGFKASKLELDWESLLRAAALADERVDAVSERSQNFSCVGSVGGVFIRHIAAILQQASVDVALQRLLSEHLGDSALSH